MQVDAAWKHELAARIDLEFGPSDLSDGRDAAALDPNVDLTDAVGQDGGTATNG